jgi:ABC-type sugar transport system ATPase subunit
VLGVRSEHVLVGNGATLGGTAQLIEPLGDATLVHFACNGAHLVAKVGAATPIKAGSALTFRFAPESCHLFDAADGARLY